MTDPAEPAGQRGPQDTQAAWQPVARAFTAAVESGRLDLPLPGSGATWERWAVLADLAAEDLIIFSEILYYFGDADFDRVLRLGISSLRPGGHLLAVHWRHPAPDHPRSGDDVHDALAAHARLARLARYRDTDFTAEVYAHRGGDLRSVAQAGGIV
jgi:SAM-dependent methyltransferase